MYGTIDYTANMYSTYITYVCAYAHTHMYTYTPHSVSTSHSQHKERCATYSPQEAPPTMQCSMSHPVECLQHLCGSQVELVKDDPVALPHCLHQHTYVRAIQGGSMVHPHNRLVANCITYKQCEA